MKKWSGVSLLSLIATFFGLLPNCLAEEQRVIVLGDNQFKESFLQKVTVSGGIRAGLMFPSAVERVDMNQLFIHLQQAVAEKEAMLCVNMVSRDGRYTASWEYALGPQSSGALAVNLPSKYKEQIGGYSPDSLVVLASVSKKDCASADTLYVPASWGQPSTTDYEIYVNSGNTDTVVGIPGHAERIKCAKIVADSTVAYDTKCVVGQDAVKEAKSLFLVRSNFGNRLPNVEIQVR